MCIWVKEILSQRDAMQLQAYIMESMAPFTIYIFLILQILKTNKKKKNF